jgi:hypothetical protein
MKPQQNKLEEMFSLREEFMRMINERVPDAYPEWPVDLSKKQNQQAIRELAFRGMEELFEALLHLKNWKDHREATYGMPDFNREEFLEEMIDAFNYFMAIIVLAGVDHKEFFDAYIRKHEIICDRLNA